MLHLDQKYLGILSSRFQRFKQKDRTLYNFRCPLCNDSASDKTRARGYAFENEERNGLVYHCHNCGITMSIRRFLEKLDAALFREYLLEAFQGRVQAVEPPPPSIDFKSMRRPTGNALDGLFRVADLPADHPASILCDHRKIPDPFRAKLYHADDFPGWARKLVPERFKDARTEARLVIPFHGTGGDLIGFQGRSYGNSGVRYLTVCLDEDAPFLYGWNTVDTNRPIIAVEGPIDSMFLPNAVASAGGSISAEVDKSGIDRGKFLIAYDNEPRSVHTVKKMRKAVKEGYAIFIWPESVNVKDFNDYVMDEVRGGSRPAAAMTKLAKLMAANVFKGIQAEIKISSWRRCDA